MKNLFRLVSLSLVAFLTLSLSSCSKDNLKDKVVGTWEQVSVGQLPKDQIITWTFNGDNTLYREVKTNGLVTRNDTANWDVTVKFAQKNIFTIYDLKYLPAGDLKGTYRINKLSKDAFRIQRIEWDDNTVNVSGTPYYWMEFSKK